MMNNRLTNDAKAVLQYAQEAAQKFHHDYVGTEHILLGLVLNTDGIAGLLLNQLGLTPENVTRAIEQHVGWGRRHRCSTCPLPHYPLPRCNPCKRRLW